MNSQPSSVSAIKLTAKQIRQTMRTTRLSLSAEQQAQAERRICQQALELIKQHQANHIALYLPVDGEISTKLLIKTLWQQGKNIYLPVLHPFSAGHLLFLCYRPDTPMRRNKFGIEEPVLDVRNIFPIDSLDIIFTPLVACDKEGNRLGMGGGFYDRSLQNWQKKKLSSDRFSTSLSAIG